MTTRDRAIDAALVGAAALDVWLTTEVFAAGDPDLLTIGIVVLAVLGLTVRRRLPYVSFLVSLPSWFLSEAMAAALIGLYTVSRNTRDRRVLAVSAAVVFVGYAFPRPPNDFSADPGKAFLLNVVYAAMTAAAPVFLGQLMLRMKEIKDAHDHERRLVAQTTLARERAQLAREMHDAAPIISA